MSLHFSVRHPSRKRSCSPVVSFQYERLFKLHRSCPLKLCRFFPYGAMQDPRLCPAQFYSPLSPLISKQLEPLP